MNLAKGEIERNTESTRIPGNVSIKAKTNTGRRRIEKSITGRMIKISASMTLMILTGTGGMASAPIYTIMDIAILQFLQDIIRRRANAASGIQIGLQGINPRRSGAVIRCQEGRGSFRTLVMCRTMFELRPSTWRFPAES